MTNCGVHFPKADTTLHFQPQPMPAWHGPAISACSYASPKCCRRCEETARAITLAGGTFAVDQPDLSHAMEVFRILRGMAYRDLGSQIPADRRAQCKDTVNENIDYGLT